MKALVGGIGGAMLLLFASLTSTRAAEDAAGPRILSGRWQQGAALLGQLAPGWRLRFADRTVSVSPQGRFVIGLAYDAPPAAELVVTDASGVERRYEYAVQPRVYDVQKIGGLPQAMVEPPPAVLARIEREQQRVAQARRPDTPREDFAQGFRWPVPATVTGVYGSRRVLNGVEKQPHFGIDLAAPEGAKVLAPAGGVVRLAQPDLYYTGGTIILDHGQGLNTAYLHLSKLDVREGQEVSAGELIGRVGKTGRATGPHLCWRANWFEVRLDPSLLIADEPAAKGERKP